MKNPLFASGFFACRAGERVDGRTGDVRSRKDGMNMIDANGEKTALSALSASATVPMLELTDAVVRRAGKDILAVPSFALAEGESMALLGPNGAGKSTFVKLITREVLPLHRDMPPVVFRGKERCTLQEVKQALGVVSATMQDEITVHVPVIEIVCGGLFGTLGVPRQYTVTEEGRMRALAALALLGVAELAERDVMTLSSGQARRVLIARALVSNPDILVFDEPCTGLDPQGMYYVRQSMRTLAQEGKTLILVTHYPEDVIPEIGRIVMIKDGLVFADGPKRELLTSERMSALFDVPLTVQEAGGYYTLSSRY